MWLKNSFADARPANGLYHNVFILPPPSPHRTTDVHVRPTPSLPTHSPLPHSLTPSLPQEKSRDKIKP